ncbi:hypothetical protein ACFYPZ_32885 [Streptomyces sp. NPDC005506]|uniref:hypothetical protein n=1 Tax=unclassified Streptomyces TaxID=2593676 RepID=UPI0036A0A3C6
MRQRARLYCREHPVHIAQQGERCWLVLRAVGSAVGGQLLDQGAPFGGRRVRVVPVRPRGTLPGGEHGEPFARPGGEQSSESAVHLAHRRQDSQRLA